MAETKFKGNPVKLAGTEIKTGDRAPKATVVTTALADKEIGGSGEKTQLLIVVPSLDTPVCATEARKFNQRAAELDSVDTTIVSMDLPFASQRFCATEGIDRLTVASDFRNREFSTKYGVLIDDGPLKGVTARAVFVINKEGKVTYRELVSDIAEEPDYDSALEAAKKA